VEGIGRVQRRDAPSGRRGKMRVHKRDGKEEGCVRKISAQALNQTPGTRYRGLISCYAAPQTRLIVMAVGCEHGHGSSKSKRISHLKKRRDVYFQVLLC